jgi:hypothetical protein
MTAGGALLARASCDGNDVLTSADEPMAVLQQRCGGDVPGPLAIPALRELVQRARSLGLKIARRMEATDGQDAISAWIEVEPDPETGSCEVAVLSWQAVPLPAEDLGETAARRVAIDRTVAELIAVLDGSQGVIAVNAEASDLEQVAAAMQAGVGRPWTDFITVEGSAHRQPVHWLLLDGGVVKVPGRPCPVEPAFDDATRLGKSDLARGGPRFRHFDRIICQHRGQSRLFAGSG